MIRLWPGRWRSPVGSTTSTLAPGNAGAAREPKVTNITITADDPADLLQFALDHHIDLTIVGPEVPLVLGSSTVSPPLACVASGRLSAAAQLEGSKAFAKGFLGPP